MLQITCSYDKNRDTGMQMTEVFLETLKNDSASLVKDVVEQICLINI